MPRELDEVLAHEGWMRTLALRLANGDLEADDIVQEAFLRALTARPECSRSPRAWLTTVMRNVARNAHRSSRRRQARDGIWSGLRSSLHTDDASETVALLDELRRALTRLPGMQREVIQGRYVLGLNSSELAARLGIPATTVRSHLKRALDALRHDLDATHDGDRAAWCAVLLAAPRPSKHGCMTAMRPSRHEIWSRLRGRALKLWQAGSLAGVGCVLVLVVISLDSRGPSQREDVGGMPGRATTLAGALRETHDARVELRGAQSARVPIAVPDPVGSDSTEPVTEPQSAGSVRLEVAEAGRGLALDCIEVAVGRSEHSEFLHPGIDGTTQRLLHDVPSPVEIPLEQLAPFELGETRSVILFVRAPSREWRRVRISLDGSSVVPVRLRRETRLRLELSNLPPHPDLLFTMSLAEEAVTQAIFRTSLPADGTAWSAEIEGLPPVRLSVRVSRASAPSHILAERLVLGVPGRLVKEFVCMDDTPRDGDSFPLSGRIGLLSDWAVPLSTISLRRVGGESDGALGAPTISVPLGAPLFFDRDVVWLPWSMEIARPGVYELQIPELQFQRRLEAAPQRADWVELLQIARLELDVVDHETGVALHPNALGFHRPDPADGFPMRPQRVSREEDDGPYVLHTVPGLATVGFEGFLADGTYRFGSLRAHLEPGLTRGTLALHRGIEVSVSLQHGESRVPFDQRVQGFSVERISGDGRYLAEQMNRRSRFFVSAPGIYRVHVDPPPEFRLAEPVTEVTVVDWENAEVLIPLR